MRFSKFGCIALALLSAFVFSETDAFSSEITADEIMKIAEKEKERFFGMMALDYVKKYGAPKSGQKPSRTLQDIMNGISPKDKVIGNKELGLGNPFRVHTIRSGDLTEYEEREDIGEQLVETDRWFVPLDISGKAHACLTVGFMDGKWRVVGISMGNFGEHIRNMPPEFRPGDKGGKFVRIYPARVDFVAVESDGETKIAMPSYSEDAFSLGKDSKDPEGLYRSYDVIPEIAKKIRAALDAHY